MHSYSVRDVERVLHLSRGTIRGLIDFGFVTPSRGPRREFRFSFQDLIVLRAARALIQAKVSRRRIRSSLDDLRRHLPEDAPLSGLSICAVGDRVVVREGENRWQVDDGQYHQPKAAAQPATQATEDWFDTGLSLEDSDPRAALDAYNRAVRVNPENDAAWVNLGRLLHEQGRIDEAESAYRRGLEEVGPHALLMFNLGVLLEDIGRTSSALEAYRSAIGEDPNLADCHYNLARLYESLGKPQHAIRHLGQYRRLVRQE